MAAHLKLLRISAILVILTCLTSALCQYFLQSRHFLFNRRRKGALGWANNRNWFDSAKPKSIVRRVENSNAPKKNDVVAEQTTSPLSPFSKKDRQPMQRRRRKPVNQEKRVKERENGEQRKRNAKPIDNSPKNDYGKERQQLCRNMDLHLLHNICIYPILKEIDLKSLFGDTLYQKILEKLSINPGTDETNDRVAQHLEKFLYSRLHQRFYNRNLMNFKNFKVNVLKRKKIQKRNENVIENENQPKLLAIEPPKEDLDGNETKKQKDEKIETSSN